MIIRPWRFCSSNLVVSCWRLRTTCSILLRRLPSLVPVDCTFYSIFSSQFLLHLRIASGKFGYHQAWLAYRRDALAIGPSPAVLPSGCQRVPTLNEASWEKIVSKQSSFPETDITAAGRIHIHPYAWMNSLEDRNTLHLVVPSYNSYRFRSLQ